MKNYQFYVSVLIPTYNEENYIENTLSNLLNNSYPQNLFESIVVDGGSTDSTVSRVNNIIENGDITMYKNTYCIHMWNQWWNRLNLDKNGIYKSSSFFEKHDNLDFSK